MPEKSLAAAEMPGRLATDEPTDLDEGLPLYVLHRQAAVPDEGAKMGLDHPEPQAVDQFRDPMRWYRERYHEEMAMTLRLSDAEAEALRRRAERESRSMQDVARQAVRE